MTAPTTGMSPADATELVWALLPADAKAERNAELSDPEILLRFSREQPHVWRKLVQLGADPAKDDDSKLDYWLAATLARYVGGNVERIARLMHFSALVRPKWTQHRTYLDLTIKGAILGLKPTEATAAQRPSFQLLDDVEIEGAPDPEWVVEGLLQTDSYAVLYGDSEGGKTFLALDWALCVASGTPWRGRKVKHGPVVYVGAEGRSGFKRRVAAWKRAHAFVGRAGVQFINATANVREAATAPQLLTDIRAKLGAVQPVMIWLDTLNRHLAGGDENSSKDIGLANATAEALREATGATVGYVHHCRRADEQERGHSSLRNAADTMMHLGVATDGETRELTCTKQREADHFEPLQFRLRLEGDSLVIDDPQVRAAGTLSRSERRAMSALLQLYTGVAVSTAVWLQASKLAERTFYTVAAELVKAGYVEHPSRASGYTPTATGRTAVAREPSSTPIEAAKEELPF